MTSETFLQKLLQLCPSAKKSSFLIAVSGGVDSMVLLHLFQKSGLKFQVAHVNYKLRNEDSENDKKLVELFCLKQNIPFHLYEVSEKDKKPEGSIQLWARNLRYQFFNQIREKENLDFLVTAHHLNDNLETFLIHLSRGSGIKGLSGIPANENKILRPLLSFSKQDIYDFANENSIEFREDYTNLKNDYLRNQLRNLVLPELTKDNPNFLINFEKSMRILNQTKDFVEGQIQLIENKISHKEEKKILFDKEKLLNESEFVHYEILRKFGFEHPKEIKKIFESETGKSFYSEKFRLTTNRNELIIEHKNSVQNQNSQEKEIIISHRFPNDYSKLEISISDFISIEKNDQKWNFDADKIVFPVKLRHKKEGDVFSPIGMIGKKKVSKFFKDEKISILAKQEIWLLCDGNDTVLGIVPFRQDKRFSVEKPAAKTLLILMK